MREKNRNTAGGDLDEISGSSSFTGTEAIFGSQERRRGPVDKRREMRPAILGLLRVEPDNLQA